MQHADQPGLGFAHLLRQENCAQRRGHREGRDQSARERVSVSLRHGAEYVTFHTAQREQRNETRDDDAGCEQDRLAYACARPVNVEQLSAQAADGRRPSGCPVSTARPAELPENPLDHDHRCIDDQSEVDGSDRQEIGRFAPQHHDSDSEEQRKRYRRRYDDSAPQIAQEHPLQHKDQQHSERHVVQDGAGRDVDEILPIRPPGGRLPELLMRSTSALTRSIVGVLCWPRRMRTIPCTMSTSSSLPAIPRRGWCPTTTVATSRTSTGLPPNWVSIVLF